MATTHCDFCHDHYTFLNEQLAKGPNGDYDGLVRRCDQMTKHIQSGRCKKCIYPKKEYVISPSYLVTFTTDPRKKYHNDLTLFQSEVEAQLKRKNIAEAMYSIEHIESNMHAHCFIKTLGRAMNDPQKDWKFMHNKVGMVKVDHVSKNNGVEAYMAKENPIFQRIGDWPIFSFRQVE